jgi:hypothetical protein
MKRVSKIITFFLTLLLFTQSTFTVQAQSEGKKPDPNFKDKATHAEKSRIPYYSKDAIVDIYVADGMFYSVDTATQDVVAIEPEVMSYQVDATYDEDQLREIAEATIADFLGDKVKLDKLSYSLVQKIGTYFFRWEDVDKQLDSGSYPFIQVGLSQNGDFLNFANTLPYGKEFASQKAPKAQMIPVQSPNLAVYFREIYANGGAYWTKSGTMSSVTGGWYYYNPTGCSGTFCSKFYYTGTSSCSTSCVKGVWKPNTNYSTKAAAYIPSTHATATVTYVIVRQDNTTFSYPLDQNAWSDAFVNITSTTQSQGFKQVTLNSYGSASKEVAWDELMVYTP